MKLMRIIVLSIVLIMVFTSCGSNTGEKTEDVPKNTVQNITVTSAPTEKPKLDTVPWGQDSFTVLLPECTFGAVTQITPGDDLCLVLVEQIEESEAVSYMNKFAEKGFTRSGADSDLYTAGLNYSNASGLKVNVVYNSGMMTLMIQK